MSETPIIQSDEKVLFEGATPECKSDASDKSIKVNEDETQQSGQHENNATLDADKYVAAFTAATQKQPVKEQNQTDESVMAAWNASAAFEQEELHDESLYESDEEPPQYQEHTNENEFTQGSSQYDYQGKNRHRMNWGEHSCHRSTHETSFDNNEDLAEMDARIQQEVTDAKFKNYAQEGMKLRFICENIGRCSICTLLPPCKHQSNKPTKMTNSKLSSNLPVYQQQNNTNQSGQPASQQNIEMAQQFSNQRPVGTQANFRPAIEKEHQIPVGRKTAGIIGHWKAETAEVRTNSPFSGFQMSDALNQPNVCIDSNGMGMSNFNDTRGFNNQNYMPQIADQKQHRGANHPVILNHHQKMNNILHTRQSRSPVYNHDEIDLLAEKSIVEDMTKGQSKGTRTQALRQMHVKKMAAQESRNQSWKHNTIQGNDRPSVRVRDRRGMYQSIDFSNGFEPIAENPIIDYQMRQTMTNDYSRDELNEAQKKLRKQEQIQMFREFKIQREFERLEMAAELQDERKKAEQIKRHKQRQFMDNQNRKLKEIIAPLPQPRELAEVKEEPHSKSKVESRGILRSTESIRNSIKAVSSQQAMASSSTRNATQQRRYQTRNTSQASIESEKRQSQGLFNVQRASNPVYPGNMHPNHHKIQESELNEKIKQYKKEQKRNRYIVGEERKLKLGVFTRGNKSPARDHPSKEAQKLYNKKNMRTDYARSSHRQVKQENDWQ